MKPETGLDLSYSLILIFNITLTVAFFDPVFKINVCSFSTGLLSKKG